MTIFACGKNGLKVARMIADKRLVWGLYCLLLAAIAVPSPGSAQEGGYWENTPPIWDNACSGTLNLRLIFEDAFQERAPLPMMAIRQRKPLQRDVEYIGRDLATGVYKNRVDRPCAQTDLLVLLNRVPLRIEPDVRPSVRTVVCLRAREGAAPVGEPTAHLLCREGETCRPDIGTDSVDVCPDDTTRQGRFGFHARPIPVAYHPDGVEDRPGWGVPSLTTLQTILKEERFGYTHFRIESKDSLGPATHAVYGLFVNGTPIYIDYQPHFDVPVRIGPESKLRIEFALPTLVFSGAQIGAETIEVDLRVFMDTERVAD